MIRINILILLLLNHYSTKAYGPVPAGSSPEASSGLHADCIIGEQHNANNRLPLTQDSVPGAEGQGTIHSPHRSPSTSGSNKAEGQNEPYWWEGSNNPFEECTPGAPGCLDGSHSPSSANLSPGQRPASGRPAGGRPLRGQCAPGSPGCEAYSENDGTDIVIDLVEEREPAPVQFPTRPRQPGTRPQFSNSQYPSSPQGGSRIPQRQPSISSGIPNDGRPTITNPNIPPSRIPSNGRPAFTNPNIPPSRVPGNRRPGLTSPNIPPSRITGNGRPINTNPNIPSSEVNVNRRPNPNNSPFGISGNRRPTNTGDPNYSSIPNSSQPRQPQNPASINFNQPQNANNNFPRRPSNRPTNTRPSSLPREPNNYYDNDQSGGSFNNNRQPFPSSSGGRRPTLNSFNNGVSPQVAPQNQIPSQISPNNYDDQNFQGSANQPVDGLPFKQYEIDPQDLRPISTGVSLNGMPMMMMPTGMNLIGGSCSAGSYCVDANTCNPYTGFIIRDVSMIAAVRPNQPQVPLIECLIPAGGITDGVCCQEAHPLAGTGLD